MKKFIVNLFFLMVLTITLSLNLTSCKEETDCTMEIYVKQYSDTMMVVPYARITVEKYDLYVEGTADAFGKYTHVFPLEAIVDVTAEDTLSSPFLAGEATVRLVPGKTVKKTIFVK